MSIVNTIFDILEIIVGACAVFNGVFCFIWNIIHFTDFYWAYVLYIIIAPLYTALFGAMIILTAVMSPGWLNQLCGFLTNFFGYGCFMLFVGLGSFYGGIWGWICGALAIVLGIVYIVLYFVKVVEGPLPLLGGGSKAASSQPASA